MTDKFSGFVDLLATNVPSWEIDYGSCRELLTAAFPVGEKSQQQIERVMGDFMRSIEGALIDEVGFDGYCQRFAGRADNGGYSVLPDRLQSRYHTSSPYEKLQIFWDDDAPKRYLFHILTTLFGEVFGRQGADHVFRPLWRSFVHNLRYDGTSNTIAMSAGNVAVASKNPVRLPAHWNETTVACDLQSLSGNPSALGHFVENLRERFIIRQDAKTLKERSRWLEAKLKELTLAKDIQGTAFGLAIQRKEHELQAKQLAAQHLQADADLVDAIELAPLRKENARLALEAEAAKMRKTIRDLTPESTKKEGSSSPEQQRANDKAACETRIESLKQAKKNALKIEDEQERMLRVNAIDDALQREMERWGRLL